MNRKNLVLVTLILIGLSSNASNFVTECSYQSMLPLVDKELRIYIQKTLFESYQQEDPTNPFSGPIIKKLAIVVDTNEIAIKYIGKAQILDDKLSSPMIQNVAKIQARVKGTQIILNIATGVNSLDGAKFKLLVPEQSFFAFPDPQVIEAKDKFGNVVNRQCLVNSHGGYNRYTLFVNPSNQNYVVLHDMISSGNPILASAMMPISQVFKTR